MGKLTFLLGGARSGKSSHAQKLAQETGRSVTFLATAQALDEDMSARIKRHQQDRPVDWVTLEIPSNIAEALQVNDAVDETQALNAMQKEIDDLLAFMREGKQDWIVISNEVGLGVVPAYQMGRAYRDILGSANQRIAHEADRVLFMVAGIPMIVKG